MMSENTENNEFSKESFQESFGDFLKKHREASGKSLDSVSRVTRIPKRFLMAFEDNAFKNFPEEAFTRGFLRSYAIDIGLDVDDVISRYDQFKRSQMPVVEVRDLRKVDQEIVTLSDSVNFPSRGLFWGGVGIVASFFLVLLLWNLRSGEDVAKDVEGPVSIEAQPVAPAEGSETVAKDVAPVISATDAKIVTPVTPTILTVKAVRNGKLTLRLDEHPIQDFEFSEGESRNFNIFKEAELKSPDRGAFQFQYNSKPLEISGPVIKLFNRNRFLGKDSR